MQAESAISLWDMSAPEPPGVEPLDGDTDADVAIVGAGYTGCSTALHLAGHGLSSVILEAETIGHGGSGRNAGLLNPGLWLPPNDVISKLGEDGGTKLVEILGAGPDYVFSLIEKHQIQCEAVRNGTIHAAHSEAGFKELAARHAQWIKLGAPVKLLNRDEAADKIGTRVFHGGLLDKRAGTINPMGYARGLARAAINAGARIHTRTKVTGLTQRNGRWHLTTTAGNVSARYCVLATNAYTDDLWTGLRKAFTPIHYFQFASQPLDAKAAGILKERQGLWDTGPVMFSARRDQAGRLIVGSMGKLIGGESGLSRTWANKVVRRTFPELDGIAWEKAWYGRIAMTADHVPRIHRLAPNLYTPIAYNGRGISPGTVFGKAIAELIAGGPEDLLPLPITALRPETMRELRAGLYEAGFKAWRLFASL